MTLIGVEWLQEVAVTFFFFFLVFTLIWGPPEIILPRAPQSVRPGLQVNKGNSVITYYYLRPSITHARTHAHTNSQACTWMQKAEIRMLCRYFFRLITSISGRIFMPCIYL